MSMNKSADEAPSVAGYIAYPMLRALSLTPRRDLFLDEKYHRIQAHYGATCLDLGSGRGDFAAFLASRGIGVTAIDVVDEGRNEAIRTQLFDGTTIPYPDNSFDTAIAMFVLHHSKNQMLLLKELGRVARGRVIIGEDMTETLPDRVLGALHLWSAGWGKAKHSFHSDAQWRDIFARLGWRLIESVAIPRYKNAVYPIGRRVYVLEPPAK